MIHLLNITRASDESCGFVHYRNVILPDSIEYYRVFHAVPSLLVPLCSFSDQLVNLVYLSITDTQLVN